MNGVRSLHAPPNTKTTRRVVFSLADRWNRLPETQLSTSRLPPNRCLFPGLRGHPATVQIAVADTPQALLSGFDPYTPHHSSISGP
jgi:hypothetical protein